MQRFLLAKRAWVVLFAAVCAVYFYGLGSVPLLGPDEPRYAEVAREMLTRGDLVTPTLGGHTWFEKPALVALRPHVRNPVYFEIHRVGEFTARSLDIDVVLDLMIHDLDIVLWLVGHDTEVTDVRAVGLPVLTNRVDAANARIEFASGAVANITASRVGTEKIRKMRFFQPHDYVAVDYAARRASISSLAPPTATGSWPGVVVRNLDIVDVEPLRAEVELFLEAARDGGPAPVTGEEGRRALALAQRLLGRIREHPIIAGMNLQF